MRGIGILTATPVIALRNRVFRTDLAYLLCPITLHVSIWNCKLLDPWWGSSLARRRKILLLLILHQFLNRILLRHVSHIGWRGWLCTKFVMGLILSRDRPPSLFMYFDALKHLFLLEHIITWSHAPTPPFEGSCISRHICQCGAREVLYLVHGIHELLSSTGLTSRPRRTHRHNWILTRMFPIHTELLLKGFLSILASRLRIKRSSPINHRYEIRLRQALNLLARLLVDVARQQRQVEHVKVIGRLGLLIFILICHFLLSDG